MLQLVTRFTISSILTRSSISSKSFHTSAVDMKALVLGVYHQDSAKFPILTEAAKQFDAQVGGKLTSLVSKFGPDAKGKPKIFYDLHVDYPVVAVVGLGNQNAGYNEAEEIDEKRENVRKSVASAAKSVRDEQNVDEVHFDPCDDPEAAAEGANLALYSYDELKSEKYKKKVVKVGVYQGDKAAFDRGSKLAEAQNVCRRLAETPANLMTPTIFCQNAEQLLKGLNNVKVIVHDKKWAEEKKMGSFLSVSKGSTEPLKFLEVHYNNKPDSKPIALVGKGICFDSGGLSLKSPTSMEKMRYDMGGAASVVSTIYALASLQAQVNVIGLTPLCENLPGGPANKPGDVVVAMNGKSIQIDNTDAEGRLVLADGLTYADEFNPQAILDVATLTGAIGVALGSTATGVFSTSTKLYEHLRKAGSHTGDRVWRMPLFSHYTTQVTDSDLADTLNVGKNRPGGGSCTAAAFLKEFVKCPLWLHLDIAGVMESKNDTAYLGKGMSGRPVRTLFHFLQDHFKSN